MDVEGVKTNTVCWNVFLKKLKEIGVEVVYTNKTKSPRLRRKVDGTELYDVLPRDFESPDCIVGCQKFLTTCQNLAIDKEKNFDGWYPAL